MSQPAGGSSGMSADSSLAEIPPSSVVSPTVNGSQAQPDVGLINSENGLKSYVDPVVVAAAAAAAGGAVITQPSNGVASAGHAGIASSPPATLASTAAASNAAAVDGIQHLILSPGAPGSVAAPAGTAALGTPVDPSVDKEEVSPAAIEAMAAAAIRAAAAAAAAGGAASGDAASTSSATAVSEQPRRKRVRRGGWDTPAAPGAAAAPVVSKGWGDAPQPVAAPVVPMNPLQELQRKLAEEQVAAAMGQGPPTTSVAAGAAALGLTMANSLPPARAATAPATPANPRRIYVGSLHYELKESDITAIFSAFGALKFVDMSHDPATGRHKGFCFIEYAEVKGADAALSAMNGFELSGRPIKVGRPHNTAGGVSGGIDGMGLSAAMQLPGMAAFMAQRSTAAAGTLGAGAGGGGVAAEQLKAAMAMTSAPAQTKIYVGNVEPHITTEMIKTVFQPFGMVVGAEMVVDPNNPGHHKGFGFIQYAQESVARTAIDTMANFELAGRSLRVAWAQDQSKPALSVLPPGLTAAAAAAQAAAIAAKAASSAAGGAAAAAAAARMTAAGQLQAAYGNGTNVGGGGGDAAGVSMMAQAQALAAQRAEILRRTGGVGGVPVPAVATAAGGVAAAASRCICLANMLGPEDADDEEIKAEILQESGTCGTVQQFHVYKQRGPAGTVVAVRIFIVYSNAGEAGVALRKMHGRFFAGRQVQAAAYDLSMFSRGLLDA